MANIRDDKICGFGLFKRFSTGSERPRNLHTAIAWRRSGVQVPSGPLLLFLQMAPNNLPLLTGVRSVFGDNPHGVDYARDVAEDRQQDVDPKLLADAYLQEHP